ncbi:unnamed protein product [Caretta caretta]
MSMEEDKRNHAARVIQRCWKRCINVRVFRYYKELIGFRGVGDPHLLMKCIDPREAELLDAAAGVYIRFRLGGTKYPPSIYYKIFTHRPIVDMCANSPKDYTKPAYKQLLPEAIHGQIWKDDRNGWYKRVENNGWRLLSIRGKQSTLADQLSRSLPSNTSGIDMCSHSKKKRLPTFLLQLFFELCGTCLFREPSTFPSISEYIQYEGTEGGQEQLRPLTSACSHAQQQEGI